MTMNDPQSAPAQLLSADPADWPEINRSGLRTKEKNGPCHHLSVAGGEQPKAMHGPIVIQNQLEPRFLGVQFRAPEKSHL